MKHNYLKHLFTALLLLCTTVATAHDFEVGGIYYNILSETDKTVAVTFKGTPFYEYSEYSGSVVIPESVNYNGKTYSVTSIGDFAFYDCTGLTSITIPNSVTSIGEEAFYKCTGLTSITIPNSVTFIGDWAFAYCYGLKEVHINDLAAWCGIDFDGYNANPLYYAKNLYLNGELVTELVIRDGVKEIKNYAFYYCSGLTSIEIGDGVTSIGDKAFYECSGLTSIEIPNSVTFIGEGAFMLCSGLTSIVIGNGVTSIGNSAFFYCSGLTSITIPNSVTSIGDLAFSGCSGLTSITIPNSVTSIGNQAFCGCTGLTSIKVESGNSVYDSRENCNAIIETATNKLMVGCQSSIIPNSVTSIGNYAFYYLKGITSITIPNSVTSIGDDAFLYCSGLTSIEIPNSVTSIGNQAFYECSGLTSIVIGNGVTSIGDEAFGYCDGLTSITIPNSVTSIGDYAFYECSGLTSIEIPNSVTSIGNQAFYGCSGLTSITSLIPADELFAIDSSVFYNVDKTTCTLYVPYGAKETYASTEDWNEFTNIVELEPTATEVTVTIGQYGNATYCSPYALDFSEVEGLKAYAATGYKSNSQVVTLTRVQTSEAGIGLFLKGEPGEYVVPVIESTDEHSLNMLVGTLEPTIVNSTAGAMSNYKFTIAEGDAYPMFYPFEDGTTLSAGKAYLQIPTAWLPATAQKSLSARFDDGETTDIDEVKEQRAESKGVYYDLCGRVVENPTSGIYVINGKKVVVK